MRHVVVVRIPGDCQLGIEFAYSPPLGLLVVKSLPAAALISAAIAPLQLGDTIESISGVSLEPGDWEDAVRQLRDALAPRTGPRYIRFVRFIEVGVPAQTSTTTSWSLTNASVMNKQISPVFGVKCRDKNDRLKLPGNMQDKHGQGGIGAELIKALKKKRKTEVQTTPLYLYHFLKVTVFRKQKMKGNVPSPELKRSIRWKGG